MQSLSAEALLTIFLVALADVRSIELDDQSSEGWIDGAEHPSEVETWEETVRALLSDPEWSDVLGDIDSNGTAALAKYWFNEELMQKLGKKVGEAPAELLALLDDMEEPETMHEAAKLGDVAALSRFFNTSSVLYEQDAKGITPMGYALSYNRLEAVKLLKESGFHPALDLIDADHNIGMHYVAGYGHTDLLTVLLATEGPDRDHYIAAVTWENKRGQTPIDVAHLNGHHEIVARLEALRDGQEYENRSATKL